MGKASKIEMTGKVFGRLTVLEEAGKTHAGLYRWVCQCSCGKQKVITGHALRRGSTLSCGCYGRERQLEAATKHGAASGGRIAPELKIWFGIKQRCLNPKTRNFADYGGRGITIAEEWKHDFRAFLAHVGPRPSPKHSIDRIHNDQGYEPGNVRWAAALVQQNNKRTTQIVSLSHGPEPLQNIARRTGLWGTTIQRRIAKGMDPDIAATKPRDPTKGPKIIEFHGLSLPATEWAKRTGLTSNNICKRLRKGWSVARALTP